MLLAMVLELELELELVEVGWDKVGMEEGCLGMVLRLEDDGEAIGPEEDG